MRTPLLTSGPRAPDHDKIDGATRPVILEDPDRQPSGPPGKRVQVGAAFAQQRPVGIIIMAVNDVEVTEATRKSLRIALPQQGRLALPIQRNVWIDAGVNIEAMSVDIHQPQLIEPGDVGLRHGGGVAAIGGQRRIAALAYPPSHLGGISQRLHHHGVVVAFQRNQIPTFGKPRQQPVNDLFAVGPFVDVVADGDDEAAVAPRMCRYPGQTIAEQIVSAVNIRNDVGQTHTAKALRRGAPRVNDVQPFISGTSLRAGEQVEINGVVAYLQTMIQRVSTIAGWLALGFIVYATLSPIDTRPVLADPQYEHFAAFALMGLAFG